MLSTSGALGRSSNACLAHRQTLRQRRLISTGGHTKSWVWSVLLSCSSDRKLVNISLLASGSAHPWSQSSSPTRLGRTLLASLEYDSVRISASLFDDRVTMPASAPSAQSLPHTACGTFAGGSSDSSNISAAPMDIGSCRCTKQQVYDDLRVLTAEERSL